MVQIRWLEEAKSDLKEIYDYISMDSIRYAQHQIKKIRTCTNVLKSHPKIGKIVAEINNPKIRELIEGNYRIIYRIVAPDKIHILMVHHGAGDLLRRLK